MLNAETYLTSVKGTGGRIRVHNRDFYVEEIPLQEPTGSGPNTWIWIEKEGRTTLDVLLDIARELHLDRRRMGFAGMKDKRAVTRQWICVSNTEPEDVRRIEDRIRNVRFIRVTRNEKKLRMGQLLGNRFRILIRDPETDDPLESTIRVLEELSEKGVPNYYGWQRFGSPRTTTHLVGRALVNDDVKGAVDAYIGNPIEGEPEGVFRARKLYDEGDIEAALEAMPPSMRYERMMLQPILRDLRRDGITEESYIKAIQVLPKPLKRMFVHAYQSYLFNRAVSERLPLGINRYVPGDIVIDNEQHIIHDADPGELEEMILNFEAHPTAPLYGSKVPLASGRPGEIERRILEEEGVSAGDFECRRMRGLGSHGMRRAIRFRLWDASASEGPDGITVEFSIPKGCYATSVLREIMKVDAA
ncbi:tRNA pseudouridine(13) synthase TruD [Methanothermobacter sp. THM-1]|uniref:tRNA pseudouridine(13) synthase TruD n=1 Tax=Methanothermobacter sp. THM-1 TaxID=2606911 RepID=UPI001366E0CA|nr:tRNA pseudouridine(13) synthase TruD [Methanothermobacter sp. THM-1]QHN05681.1 tRNA pseudouridine(13) synthase TruD [Methanothermobacter sp. THM-1]